MTGSGSVPRKHQHLKAFLCMLGATLAFATMGALVKSATTRLPSTETAFARTFINLLILLPWMLWQRIPFFGQKKMLLFTRGLAGWASLGLAFYATAHIRLVDVTVLHKTSIFFTSILAGLLLKEKITSRLALYSLVGFAGACLIIKPTFEFINIAGLAALGAGLLVSVVSVSIRQLHGSEHAVTIVFAFCLYASAGFWIFFSHLFLMPTPEEFKFLLLIGFTGTIGQLLFTFALRAAPASFVAPFSLLEVLFSAIIGIQIFREVPDPYTLLGAALILYGGYRILSKPQQPV